MPSLHKCSLIFQGLADWLPVGWSKFFRCSLPTPLGDECDLCHWAITIYLPSHKNIGQNSRTITAGFAYCEKDLPTHPTPWTEKYSAPSLSQIKLLKPWHDTLMVSTCRREGENHWGILLSDHCLWQKESIRGRLPCVKYKASNSILFPPLLM